MKRPHAEAVAGAIETPAGGIMDDQREVPHEVRGAIRPPTAIGGKDQCSIVRPKASEAEFAGQIGTVVEPRVGGDGERSIGGEAPQRAERDAAVLTNLATRAPAPMRDGGDD